MKVTKADGTQEEFKSSKLRNSLRKAGAHKEEVDSIVSRIEAEIHPGIKTEEIYRHAFTYLRDSEVAVIARYSLRRALFGLGPTGFPFEDFLARLFAVEGYNTRTELKLAGKCVSHEIDLAAYKKDHAFVAEAKFHARPGIKSDLQVVMYCYARLLDLKDQKICADDICGIKEYWVITNTKFTTTAEKYAKCVGMHLLSWDSPRSDNLYDRIQKTKLYPLTVLQRLTASEKKQLLDRKMVVCKDLLDNPRVLRHLHISPRKTEAVLSEARQLSSQE